MNDYEDHFTVFIRLPFPRGDFVDPSPVAWSASKERDLWEVLSRQSKGNDVNWLALAEKFQVSQSFLLQQAAWLYERQLSQVRAQMRKMGNRSSNTASPAPGSAIGSVVGAQSMKRTGSGGSRVPSRLSTQNTPLIPQEASTPNTPARSRTSLPFRPGPTSGQIHSRVGSTTSRPLSRQSSKDADLPSRTHSRRGSVQHQTPRSPAQDIPQADSSSEEEPSQLGQSRLMHRRPNPSANTRRTAPARKTQHTRRPSAADIQLEEEEEDDEDSPAFLPFSRKTAAIKDSQQPGHDPSATLKGTQSQTKRPVTNRRSTSERITSQTTQQARAQTAKDMLTSSESDALESPRVISNLPAVQTRQPKSPQNLRSSSGRTTLPNPLSPVQQAALAQAAGLSPRRRSTNPQQPAGSDTSPSMGSSFSDLDDASVTQSALEEALLSGMGNTTMTIGGGAGGGVASRVSGISQALRSRYFDGRAGNEESQR